MHIYYFYYEKLVLQTTNYFCTTDKYAHALMNIYSIHYGLQIYNHNNIDRNDDNIIP